MKSIFTIFALIFCSIIFTAPVIAQEKVLAYQIQSEESAALAETADKFAVLLAAEPLSTRGFINVYENSDEAKTIISAMAKKVELKNRVVFFKPGIRYQTDNSSGIEFWLVPTDAESPYSSDCVLCVCPSIKIVGGESAADDNADLVFTAEISGGSGETVSCDWKISAGEILEGQGTPTIKVAAHDAHEITAILEIGGVCEECVRVVSLTSKIKNKLKLIDDFGLVTSDQIRNRMDKLLTMLNDNPKARGYVINYGSRTNKKFLKQRERQIADYFIYRPTELRNRITIIESDLRKDEETELWFAPDEDQKPVPTPTVDKRFGGISKPTKKPRQ